MVFGFLTMLMLRIYAENGAEKSEGSSVGLTETRFGLGSSYHNYRDQIFEKGCYSFLIQHDLCKKIHCDSENMYFQQEQLMFGSNKSNRQSHKCNSTIDL